MLRKLLNLSIISVLMVAALIPSVRGVQAQEPEPAFHVNPDSGYVCTGLWPIGVTLTLNIDNDEDPLNGLIYTDTQDTSPAWWDPDVGEVCFEFFSIADQIQPGMYVSVSDGTITKDTYIVPLSFDTIDPGGNASGSGPSGGFGHACLDFSSGCQDIEVSSDGVWTAYFDWYVPDVTDLNDAHVVIWDEDGDETLVFIDLPEPPPLPIIEANLTTDSLGANDLGPEELNIRLELYYPGDDPETTDPKCSGDFYYEPEQDNPWLDCWDVGVDPGDQVYLLIDDQQIKTHVVYDLSIDGYDFEDGIMSGSGPPDRDGWVYVCNPDDTCYSDGYTTLGDGSWSVLFGPGLIEPEAWFLAAMPDEDEDRTNAEMFPEEIPNMDVNVSGDWISAWGFGPEAQFARLEVWRGPDLLCEGDFDLSEGDPWLECWQQDTDILPDDQVLLIVDGTQVKDHIVFDLTLDEVNTDEGFFAGTAPMETTVRVDVCNPPDWECISQEYTTWSGLTTWEISFGPGVVDPDAWYAAFITDEDGDQTIAEPFWAPQPWFTIHPGQSWVQGVDWPIEVMITVTVDDNSDPDDGILYQETEESYSAEWDPSVGTVWFDLSSVADVLTPSIYVSLTDGDTFKDVWIPELGFDSLDPDTYIASGFGPVGAMGYVCLDQGDESICHDITIPESGIWEVDFSGDAIDLSILTDPHVSIWDEDGEEIVANLFLLQPAFFNVNLTAELIHAIGWPYGEIITLEIDDPATTQPVDYSTEGTVEGFTSYDPNLTLLDFDAANYGLMPGFLVRIYNENFLKEHIVTSLIIDEVNYETWSVSGSTESYSLVDVIGVGLDPEYYPLISDQDGYWKADFNQAVENFELIIISNWDQDGDATQRVIFPSAPINPSLNVNLTENIISALDWPLESLLTLEIDDPQTSDPVDFSSQGTVTGYSPYDDEQTLFEFDTTNYEVLPGYAVKVYDSVYTKEHLVTDLTIDSVIVSQNQVIGSTGPFAAVDVLAIGSELEFQNIESDQDGTWTANFSLDLSTALAVIAWEGDGDGDTTQRLWFPNSPPVAADDFYSTDEDLILSVEATTGVLSNDSDAENDILEAILVENVQHGLLVLDPDGSFSYTPDQDFHGADSFSYSASDGSLESEIAMVSITINPVNDIPQVLLPSEFTINEGQSFFASGSFSDPDEDDWTGTVDYLSDGVEIQLLTLNAEKGFDLNYAYPADDGIYFITVSIEDGHEVVSAPTMVTVQNVPPNLDIQSVGDGEDYIFTGMAVNLTFTFNDPGTDTHAAVITWGSADDASTIIDPALTPVTVSHVYHSPGVYPLNITVTDDDGGTGYASTSITIVEPAEIAQIAIAELDTILEDPDLPAEAASAVEAALVNLEGANDGLSSSGALDKIDGGQWNSALVKIEKAIQDLEVAQAADPTLNLSELIQTLVELAEAVALEL